MNMKKLTAILLSLSLCLSLAACGKKSTADTPAQAVPPATQTVPAEKPAEPEAPPAEQKKEPVIGTAYDDTVSEIVDSWDTLDPNALGISNVFSYKSNHMGFQKLDINGDGRLELLLGEGGDQSVIYDLFTQADDGKLIHLATGGERDRFYLCSNGILAEEGSSSANDSFVRYFTLSGTVLTETNPPADTTRIDLDFIPFTDFLK